MTGVWTPQWLYQHVTIPPSARISVESTAFKNDTPWAMPLKWLSLAGKLAGPAVGGSAGLSGVLRFELSITQKGDINYALANVDTLFCGHQNASGIDFHYDFNPSFPIGPDEGLVVELTQTDGSGAIPPRLVNPGVVFNGVRFEPRFGNRMFPAVLASTYPGELEFNQSVVLNSTDLYNNGEEPIWLRGATVSNSILSINGTGVGVKLNPTSGIPWLPQNDFIPLGNLFPCGVYLLDFTDVSQNVYKFPYQTVLNPRQRLKVEIKNLSAYEQKIGLCLHGLIEVK